MVGWRVCITTSGSAENLCLWSVPDQSLWLRQGAATERYILAHPRKWIVLRMQFGDHLVNDDNNKKQFLEKINKGHTFNLNVTWVLDIPKEVIPCRLPGKVALSDGGCLDGACWGNLHGCLFPLPKEIGRGVEFCGTWAIGISCR